MKGEEQMKEGEEREIEDFSSIFKQHYTSRPQTRNVILKSWYKGLRWICLTA
jgi:hypothetical protein